MYITEKNNIRSSVRTPLLFYSYSSGYGASSPTQQPLKNHGFLPENHPQNFYRKFVVIWGYEEE